MENTPEQPKEYWPVCRNIFVVFGCLFIFLALPIWAYNAACGEYGFAERTWESPRRYPTGFYYTTREHSIKISGTLSKEYADLIDRHLTPSSVVRIRLGNTILAWGWAWFPSAAEDVEEADRRAVRDIVALGRTEGHPFRQGMPADIRKALDSAGNATEIFEKNCLLVRALTIENWGRG